MHSMLFRLCMGFASLAGLLLFSGAPLEAQGPASGPQVIGAVRHDVSPPLRDITPRQEAGRQHEMHRHETHPQSPTSPTNQTDPVLQTSAGPLVATTPGLNFEGIGQGAYGFTVNSAPPDTNGAVGATQFLQWVNSSFAVFNKSTGALVFGPAAGNTLWTGFGGRCETSNDGDPIAQYDKAAGRWVVTQPVFTSPYMVCIAVSTTSDATGTYNRYAFAMPNFPDYPKLGIWPDAYYMSFNMFAGNFLGANACAMDRAKMLTGAAATMHCFQQSSSVASLLPSDLDGTTPPPAGSPAFFLNYGSNSLKLWKFHVDFTTPANSTFTGPVTLAVAAFSPACSGGTCIPQLGTTNLLDSLADRLMYRLAYRNFGGHDSLVVNHAVTVGSSVGIRWYELQNPNTSPVVFQQGTYAPDSDFRWMGSIAMDSAGDIAVGYSDSSSAIHPSIRYTGRTPADPLGILQVETAIINGTGSQLSGLTRWGDYSSVSVDPVDDCTFWYTNEYLKADGTFNWSTRIASFKFPSCGAQPDFALAASPNSQTVVQGAGTTYTVTVTPSGGFSGTVSFSVSGLPGGATPGFSPATVTQSGSTTLSVATLASTPAGSYPLSITGTSGGLSHSVAVTLVVSPSGPPPVVSPAQTSASTGCAATCRTAFPSPNSAGNLIIVAATWGSGQSVSSISDTQGNTYKVGAGLTTGPHSFAKAQVWYAENVKAGANTVSVVLNASSPFFDVYVHEFSRVATANSLDASKSNIGTSTALDSGTLATTTAGLLFSFGVVGDGLPTATSGFTSLILADDNRTAYKVTTAPGSYNATFSNTANVDWLDQLAAFKSSGPSDTTPPTAPTNLTATVVSGTQINLAWTASTDNVGVTGYKVERCQGAGCSNFAQVATPAGTTYNDTGLQPSTSYSYRVRATDAAGNLSGYSNTATATTAADTTPPTAPTNLTPTVVSGTQINLAWTASTDNVGVTGYKVERCQGAGCSNFAQVATPAGTTYNDTGLAASTSYSYRVRATDAAGNLSGYSNTASATTQTPDTTPPTAPTNLIATAASAAQINLSWTASTDNVGVTGYKVERCQGAGCSNFAQVATPTGTTYNDTGLAASTGYSYRVRATDAAGNLSGYSNTATATTSSGAPPPISAIQADSATYCSSTCQVPFPAVNSAGNLIVVAATWDPGQSIVSISDTQGNTYHVAGGLTTGSNSFAKAQIWYAENVKPGANTVKVVLNASSSFFDVYIHEFSGVVTSNSLDGTAVKTGNGAALDSGPVTTTTAGLLFAFAVVSDAQPTATSGFASLILANGNLTAYKLTSGAGSFNATFSDPSVVDWLCQIVAFK